MEQTTAHVRLMSSLPETPIVDSLLALRRKNVHSFHALPISNARSIVNSRLFSKYADLYGESYFASDLSYSGFAFDSFFFPKSVINEAQQLASSAFGSKQTFFVTSGSTVAAQIAVDAAAKAGDLVLLDRACHQSFHFALQRARCEVTYVESETCCNNSQRRHVNIHSLLQTLRDAAVSCQPYRIVVLNASSYDGIIYDLPKIVGECVKIQEDIVFLLDEAWSAHSYFHPTFRRFSAMHAGRQLESQGYRARIVSIQSAHKALSALRQASYVHVFGDDDLTNRIMLSRFKLHTTSPSYPILASLDLARAQMVAEGEALIERAIRIANHIVAELATNPELSAFQINMADFTDARMPSYFYVDPTKISINLKDVGIRPDKFRQILFNEYGNYISRYTETSVLINIHIGVDENAAEDLLGALRRVKKSLDKHGGMTQKLGVSDRFVIPYPPGVPLIIPGEEIKALHLEEITRLKNCGIEVFEV